MKNILPFLTILILLSASCEAFTDENIDIIPTPVLETPADSTFLFYNDTAIILPLTFYWSGSTYTNNYLLEIAENNSFDLNLQTYTTSIYDAYDWQTEVIRDTTRYFWRVKSLPPPGADYTESLYSVTSTFEIGVPDEIICYKCGVYNCLTNLEVTDDNVDTLYQNVPMTLAVIRNGNSNQYSISYSLQVDGYQLSTTVDAYDYDEVYRIQESGVFTIGNYAINVPNVGLTQINSNWSFLNDPEVEGHLLYTEMQGNLQVYCSFSGSK